MIAFGWRIPFLLSIFLVVVGLVVRLRMAETPVFQKAAAEIALEDPAARPSPPLEARRFGHLRGEHHLHAVLPARHLVAFLRRLHARLLSAAVPRLRACRRVLLHRVHRGGMPCVPTAAAASRCSWSRPQQRLCSAWCAPLLLGSGTVAGVMAFLCVGFVCMGAVFGPCGSYLPELFPANVRYSGAGLSYNLAAIVGGAFAPTIASALVMNFGLGAVGPLPRRYGSGLARRARILQGKPRHGLRTLGSFSEDTARHFPASRRARRKATGALALGGRPSSQQTDLRAPRLLRTGDFAFLPAATGPSFAIISEICTKGRFS